MSTIAVLKILDFGVIGDTKTAQSQIDKPMRDHIDSEGAALLDAERIPCMPMARRSRAH
jgi:hypothetical protein